jgi:threonine dehydrogenase-like Zn-dependent dehydrogenase
MRTPAPPEPRRSTAQRHVARAIWYARAGVVELRTATLPPLKPDEARVRTSYSGISRGTERLILSGGVPPAEYGRMRAPLQDGAFPFPVKYGYCATGVIEAGPAELIGQRVFCLHPHQDVFNAAITMLIPLPDALPARRATLAANMETALNALWDSGAGPGDRIVVVGGGIVGLMVASLAASLPGSEVTVADVAMDRQAIIEALGATYAHPATAPANADVVFHTSATAAGLETAINSCGLEATLVELSWYGTTPVSANLGGAFHSRRLKFIASQVGQVAPSRRPRWDYRRRLEKALDLLCKPVFDTLVADHIDFDTTPTELPRVLLNGAATLPPVIRYAAPTSSNSSET